MFKKKEKKGDQNTKKQIMMHRVDTQADTLPYKQSKTRAQIQQRFQNTQNIAITSRHKIKCKQMQKIFMDVKNILEEQLDHLLIGQQIWQTYQAIMQSQLFRTKHRTKDDVTQQLGNVIQALELLYSKLHNNQKVKDILYVKDQSQLLLFFKHLFGKPYTVCNLPSFRKVLNSLWQHQIFKQFSTQKIADHLRLWCCGINYPLNPAAIPLHRFVFNNPLQIKKYSLLLSNSIVYCDINEGDCMGLTPLLTAVHSNRNNAYQQIIKAGANIYRCPLTWIKGSKVASISKKSNKQVVQITFPIHERKQFNAFQILLSHKQFQQIINILSLNEVYKLKKLKKSFNEIKNKLKQMPDCCFQIHWKTFKGFLSFRQLPKDIITVYKKGSSLRIDYHVDDIQSLITQPQHFSILIRAEDNTNSKLQYYYIDHHNRKIYNLMRQIHGEKLKLRYEQITQLGNIEQQIITYLKSTSKINETPEITDINVQYCYQNVSKAQTYQFKDSSTYERALFQSNVVDYSLLERSQTQCTLSQNIGQQPKVKSKLIRNSSSFKFQWIKQKINLRHVCYVLSLLDKKSPLFVKIQCLFTKLLNEQTYEGRFSNKIPVKMNVDLGSEFSLQMEIKNLMYLKLDDAVFGLQFRTKTQQYEQQNVDLSSLQETMIMQENYSINMSRFLGKTQKLLDIQEQQANRLFQELLSRQISGQLSDQEDSSQNDKKSDIIGNCNSQRVYRPQQE